MQWRIGSVRITSIIEQELGGLNDLIRGALPDAVKEIGWLRPLFADEDGHLSGLIQSFVIETPKHLVVVDTCVGNDKERPIVEAWHKAQTEFLSRLRQAGFKEDGVDFVLCTHMHLDHVGWNTYWDGTAWKPTFPNARYLFADTEIDHWTTENAKDFPDPSTASSRREEADLAFSLAQVQTHRDSVQPIFDAGLADIVPTDHVLCSEVKLLPTPGHTPGHVSIHISSDGEEAIISGDCVHHPCQIAHPEWKTSVDVDPDLGIETRKKLFSRLEEQQSLLIGSHFNEPTAGKVEKKGDGYILIVD